jgi:uncharacterized protein (DUF433 family)
MRMEIVADPVPLTVDEYGTVRIAGTRVTLDTLIACYQQGNDALAIVEGFPALQLADVYAVIAYYLRHREEVDRYLEQNEREAEEVRRLYEAQFGKQPSLAELEARRLQRQL